MRYSGRTDIPDATPMTFLWPNMLWLLLAVPALVAVYLWLLRRRGKSAVRFASVAMIKSAITPGQRLRRHLPPLLFLVGIAAALVAAARPAATVTLPSQHKTVILAIDVSLSMRAADVEPDRITAAQAAARSFVEEQADQHPASASSRSAPPPRWWLRPPPTSTNCSKRSTASSCSGAPPPAAR